MKTSLILLASGALIVGCGNRLAASGQDDESGSGGGESAGPGPDIPSERVEAEIQVVSTADVDVLFVIDNSATLADEQVFLADNAKAFVQVLDQANVNYRVGFTTTDVGNPACDASTPERGRLILQNCLANSHEFVSGSSFVFDQICTPFCEIEDIEIQPTPTLEEPQPQLRPWLEKIQGVSNLPVDVTMTEAMSCYLPVGIAGCRFESPLEAMYLALNRFQEPTDDGYGFMRQGAHLAIVLVTDEVDCSYKSSKLFDGSNTIFWPEPTDLTSATCWNAGVQCIGGGPVYQDCFATNKDLAGNTGVADSAAVMQPLSRYLSRLGEIDALKKSFDPEDGVSVSGIAGVPVGYPQSPIVYKDINDDNFMNSFGIGPGCESATAQAIPPPRIKEITEAYGIGSSSLSSVCDEDYSSTLEEIGSQIGITEDPPCFPICAGDIDPLTPGLQPDCRLFERPPADAEYEMAHCEDQDGSWVIPQGETACFYELVEDMVTGPCMAEGANLEFAVIRTEPVQEGTVLTADCVISDNPGQDCP
jgi:hypothetical protein